MKYPLHNKKKGKRISGKTIVKNTAFPHNQKVDREEQLK